MALESLADLPDDVLILLFSYCDIKSLGRLAQTSKAFKDIIYKEGSVWIRNSSKVIGSNMAIRGMQLRCKPVLSYRDRCKVSKEWCKNSVKCTEISLFKKCMPWTVVEKDNLYLCRGRRLVKYIRDEKGNVIPDRYYHAVPCKDDIAKFVINSEEIVCGGRDGRLTRLNKLNMNILHSVNAHDVDILTVDSKKDIIISGSKDSSVKIWKCFPSKTECKMTIDINNRILSTAILPSNRAFVVGTPGTKSVHPLQMYHIASGKHIMNFGSTYKNGAGILDLFVDSPFGFYSCGYDTTLRLWDIRSPMNSVAEWTEPFDNTLYCVQSDYNVTVMTGSCRHGCSWIFDKRMTRRPVKSLFVNGWNNTHLHSEYTYWYKGPVYSLAFDAAHVFVALDKAIVEFSYI